MMGAITIRLDIRTYWFVRNLYNQCLLNKMIDMFDLFIIKSRL